jgi:hypothetical protein
LPPAGAGPLRPKGAPLVPSPQDTNAADAVLYFCKRLWGQSIVGAIFALLLHRWLLLRPEAGGLEQRQKHVHVLMLGAPG